MVCQLQGSNGLPFSRPPFKQEAVSLMTKINGFIYRLSTAITHCTPCTFVLVSAYFLSCQLSPTEEAKPTEMSKFNFAFLKCFLPSPSHPLQNTYQLTWNSTVLSSLVSSRKYRAHQSWTHSSSLRNKVGINFPFEKTRVAASGWKLISHKISLLQCSTEL